MQTMKIKVKEADLMYLLLLIPFFPPDFISYQLDAFSSALNQLLNLGMYISAITVGLIYLRKPQRYYGKFILAIALYSSLIVVSTFINSGNIIASINLWGKRVAVCMLLAIITYEKRFGVVCSYLKICILINILLSFIMPSGFGTIDDGNIISFMGHKNLAIQYLIIFLTLRFIQNGTDKRIVDKIWIFICILNVILGTSSTGITLFVLYAILLLFPFSKIKEYISEHSMEIYILTTVVSIVLTLSTQLIVNIPAIQWFILKALGKSLDFTLRTTLWTETWFRVWISPFFGLGNVTDLSEIQRTRGTFAAHMVATDHNAVLSIIYRTGFVGLAGFVVLCVIASYSKDRSIKKSKESIWISLGILILLIDGFMEGVIVSRYYLYWMMLLQYASNHDSFRRCRSVERIQQNEVKISGRRIFSEKRSQQ